MKCSVKNCKNENSGKGLCQAHYRRKKIYGDCFPDVPIGGCPILIRKNRPFTRFLMDGVECIKIPLTKGLFTIVDVVDIWATNFKWYCMKGRYAVRRQNGKHIYLHREIIKCRAGLETDHINRNGLDNRRCNLRPASKSQNGVNKEKPKFGTSKFRGVSIYSARGVWQAQIKINGKNRGLGHFIEEEKAAAAYDKAAKIAFGDRAILNFK